MPGWQISNTGVNLSIVFYIVTEFLFLAGVGRKSEKRNTKSRVQRMGLGVVKENTFLKIRSLQLTLSKVF